MMKQFLLLFFAFWVAIGHSGAQTIRELVIEPDPEPKPSNSVFSSSCNSPDLGAIVFSSAISGLWFDMDPKSKLINKEYNRQRNEYVMCVEPTEGIYRFLISHADYKAVDFIVENVQKSSIAPQFFKINPKENTSNVKIENESKPTEITTNPNPTEKPNRNIVQSGTPNTLGAGLVAYYTFDNENAYDATDNELHASLINNPAFTSETASGKGKALFLNSSRKQLMNIPYNPLKGEKNYTISIWVKDFGTGVLFAAVSGAYLQYDVPRLWATSDGKFELFTFTTGGTLRPSVTPFSYSYRDIQSGKWHLITIVCKTSGNSGYSGKKELYIDGILTDTANDNISDHYGERTKIQIGGNGDGKYPVFSSSMKVDNIRIYNRSLDAKEVMAIYNLERQ